MRVFERVKADVGSFPERFAEFIVGFNWSRWLWGSKFLLIAKP